MILLQGCAQKESIISQVNMEARVLEDTLHLILPGNRANIRTMEISPKLVLW